MKKIILWSCFSFTLLNTFQIKGNHSFFKIEKPKKFNDKKQGADKVLYEQLETEIKKAIESHKKLLKNMKPNYGLLISEAFSKFYCYESIKRSYEALSKISLILKNPSELKNRNDLNSPDKFEKLIIKILKEKYYLFDFKKRENYKQEVTSIVKIVYLHKKS